MSGRSERRKAARRQREHAEREGGRELERLTDEALSIALDAVAEVATAQGRSGDRIIEIDFPSVDAARYAQKRINEALGVREWSDEVRARVWTQASDGGSAASPRGRDRGFELRLERRR